MQPVTPKTPGRRERVRNATVAEIKEVARAQLAGEGPQGISLRAIARDMGMSTPALYRYFPSLEALVVALCVDLYEELGAYMLAACGELGEHDYIGRLLVAARSFRAWAVAHRNEFTLMFSSAVTATHGAADTGEEPHAAATRFSRIFGVLFEALFRQSDAERGFPLPEPNVPPMSDRLAAEVAGCVHMIGADVPPGFAYVFMSYWIRLYGQVAMEVYGQLPVVAHPDELFDAMLFEMAGLLNVDLSARRTDAA